MKPERAALVLGAVVVNDRPFTSPIGAHFAAGERFEVEIVGRSTRCRHARTGSVVWLRGSAVGSTFSTG